MTGNASAQKYLICNGNEDEPGTFKDRILLEETPHQVIEGAVIAALATGVNRIIFYINPEQTESLASIREAVKQWQGSELNTAVTRAIGEEMVYLVMESSGHYIGGEETAAIESVEGKFPFPRGKPPFPAQSGVHGNPTLINNIETLSNVSHIIRNGAEWYRNLGLGDACGTKIYCLSGDVLAPGAYELPMGTRLVDLIQTYGGGMLLERHLKAVFTGGPSNTILTPKHLDVALDFDSVAKRRSALGTGAMIVVSEGTGIVKRVTEYVNFFAASSCGDQGAFAGGNCLSHVCICKRWITFGKGLGEVSVIPLDCREFVHYRLFIRHGHLYRIEYGLAGLVCQILCPAIPELGKLPTRVEYRWGVTIPKLAMGAR